MSQSERSGGVSAGIVGSLSRVAVWKVAAWAFGSVGAVAALLVGLVLVLVVIAGFSVASAQQSVQTEPVSGVCTVDGGSSIPEEFRDDVTEASVVSGIPVEVLAAQIDQESGWNPRAVSHRGAMGLTQFMPDTWSQWGAGDPFDPVQSVKAQGAYMGWIREWVGQNFDDAVVDEDQVTDEYTLGLILAGYNAGVGTIQQAGGVPDIGETKNYVVQVLGMAQGKYSDSCESPVIGEIGSGQWVHPHPGSTITSMFGPRNFAGMNFHYGVDFSGGNSKVIVAPVDMKITLVESGNVFYGDWLIGVQVDDPGYVFEFHHFVSGSIKVSPGQTVASGTPLAVEGNTGNSFGDHLHFQMAPPGTDPTRLTMPSAVDPLPILKKAGVLQ